eukprot:CAMPEP_0170650556 /NCGR_PEP_ID=MMETSP0224-20130122/45864_1 /TAXON_ID=285029 /ORGANISM="Togula jolla, Strain CCCM 725" /LENGTH=173 /DNA_ID=CAMNT_0010982223 /DNA_START=78 /DNA_END=598 /DNA_ORIENTATION=+
MEKSPPEDAPPSGVEQHALSQRPKFEELSVRIDDISEARTDPIGCALSPPAAAKDASSEDEFVVEVEKTVEQSKIGLQVDKLWGRILIVEVKKGLIDDYNKTAAERGLQEVRAGHHIVAVNGLAENSAKMLKAVSAEQILKAYDLHPEAGEVTWDSCDLRGAGDPSVRADMVL